MPRKSSVWFRKADGHFYTTINRKAVKLSADKGEAERLFHALMAEPKQPRIQGRPTFRAVADAYLEHCQEACSPETFKVRQHHLQSFCDHIKARRVPDLRGADVTAWLKARRLAKSTRSLAVQIVKAAINYAIEQGTVALNPLTKLKRPGYDRRERLLTPEEREKIRVRLEGTSYGDFIYALSQTGARPFSEVAKITAGMVDWEAASVTLRSHKTASKGKRRTIHLTPGLLEMMKRLASEHPDGPLFRTAKGKPWCRQAASKWTAIFAKELGIAGASPYSLRHTYCTTAVERGVPLPILAELVGNSVQVIMTNYLHVEQRQDTIKAAALKAVNG